MAVQLEAGFHNAHAFAFEEFFLQRGVRLADEDFSLLANNAMPGDSFSGGSGGHGAARAACAAAETQDSSEAPIG